MKRRLNIIALYLVLLFIEYVVLFLCFQLEAIVNYSIPFYRFHKALRYANEITLIRLIFYSVFWIFVMSFIYGEIRINNSLLKLMAVNTGVYVFTSAMMSLIFPFAIEFFTRPFFFYLVLATLISPCILYLIPFGRRLIQTI